MNVAERIAVLEARRSLESPIADLPVEGTRYCVCCGERLVAPVFYKPSPKGRTIMHRHCAEDRGFVERELARQ